MPRKFYSSKYAHDEYRSVLVDCRVGINQTPESIQSMNDLLVPLIKEKHQSIGHIYATHAEELGCSRRTLYSYINDCVFDVRNGDLRRSVRYKKRKKPTQTSAKDRSYRQGHNYEKFPELYERSSRYKCCGNGLRGRNERRKLRPLDLYIPQLQSYAYVPVGISKPGMRVRGLCMA